MTAFSVDTVSGTGRVASFCSTVVETAVVGSVVELVVVCFVIVVFEDVVVVD